MARPKKKSSDSIIKEIKRKTRRKFSSEEKIRIVIEGLKGEESVEEKALHLPYITDGVKTS